MRFPHVVPVVIAMVTFAAGCGDSEPTAVEDGVTIADLVGSWTASSQVFTDNSNSAESFDVIAAGGETRTTVLTGGRARTWLEWGDFQDEWDAQLTMSGTTLTSTPAESTRETVTWTFTLVGDVLTLSRTDSSFDFTLSDGDLVSATEVIVLERQ